MNDKPTYEELEAENKQLLDRLAAVVYRLDEVWNQPAIAGDITSFWPDGLMEKLQIPVEGKRKAYQELEAEIRKLKSESEDNKCS
jgi:hypothetical protein